MAEIASLGRLTSIRARDIWPHEASDFTPWLLNNADVLSDALGMDLELSAAEHPVGGFSLDLIGTDRTTGDLVIVENQLETSDHGHLGQILTYAGGTQASNIVWLAPAFREEHRAALDWLNERTDESTRFFAVRVQVVRIGESQPAPLLTLEVQPNDWGKQVRATASPTRRWTEAELIQQLDDVEPPGVAVAIQDLLNHHRGYGHHASFYWGEGQHPSVTAVLKTDGARLQPWSIFSNDAPGGGAVWALNLDWIHKQGRAVPGDAVRRLVERLASLPGVGERCEGAESVGWRKRPSIPAQPLFTDPQAVTTIASARVVRVHRRTFRAVRIACACRPFSSLRGRPSGAGTHRLGRSR